MDAIGIAVGSGRLQGAAQADYLSSQVVAIGAAAASTQVFATLNTVVTLRATVNCWFSVGATAAAHVAGSDYLPANTTWMLKIPQNATLSFIQDATAGYVSVTPMANPNAPGFVSTAVAAFSMRSLNPAYTGPCIRVRRSTDSVVQDIGFVSGNLDVTTLNAFLAAATGFITIWYDQSGLGNNAAQPTVANQPTIVTSVAALNSRPAILFGDASVFYLAAPASPSLTGMFATGGTASTVVNLLSTPATNNDRIWARGNTITFKVGTPTNPGFTQAATTSGFWNYPALAVGGHVVDVTYSSAALANVPIISVDRTAQTLGTSQQPVGTITSDAPNPLQIGGVGSLGWNGHIGEAIFWNTQPFLGPIRAGQKTYWGTP